MKKKKLVEYFYTKSEIKAVNEGIFDEQETKLSPEITERAMSTIKEYNKYGKSIYREGNLRDIAKTLGEIAEFASRYTVENANDWFDSVTVKRNMNELKKLSSNFNKVATEVQSAQDRMSALYEDMGGILNRYFTIETLTEEPEPVSHDNIMRKGDRATVDLNKVRKHNPTPSYMKKVKNEIIKGKGTVCIQEIGKSTIRVSGGDIALYEVEVPIAALTKTIPGQKISEAVKFDADKMKKLAKSDKFIESQLKSMSAEKVFDNYIKGNADEEKKYNKIK